MLANTDMAITSLAENEMGLWQEKNLEEMTGASVCHVAKGRF